MCSDGVRAETTPHPLHLKKLKNTKPEAVAVDTGGGAWGTALAIHCARMGHRTLLWAREPEVVASVNGPARENTTFLKVGGEMHRSKTCWC